MNINILILEKLDENKKKKLKKLAIAGGLAALGGGALAIRHADNKIKKSQKRRILTLAGGAVGLGVINSARNGAINTLYHLHRAKKYNDIALDSLNRIRRNKDKLTNYMKSNDVSLEDKQKTLRSLHKVHDKIAGHQLAAKINASYTRHNTGPLNSLLKSRIEKTHHDIDSNLVPRAHYLINKAGL